MPRFVLLLFIPIFVSTSAFGHAGFAEDDLLHRLVHALDNAWIVLGALFVVGFGSWYRRRRPR